VSNAVWQEKEKYSYAGFFLPDKAHTVARNGAYMWYASTGAHRGQRRMAGKRQVKGELKCVV